MIEGGEIRLKGSRLLPRLLRVECFAGHLRACASPLKRESAWIAVSDAEPERCRIAEVGGDPFLVVGSGRFEVTESEAAQLIERFQIRDERPVRPVLETDSGGESR